VLVKCRKWLESNNKYIQVALWIVLLCACVATRVWRVTTIPSGIHIDEAGMAYDAWCLSEYGVDRFLKSWPAYLNNYGGGQSSLYAFLCALSIKVMGFSVWSIRLPGIIVSVLNVIYGVKIGQKIYGRDKYWGFILGGLLIICPYFIMAGRFGLDCNLMLGVSTIFLYYFMQAVGGGENKDYVIAGIWGGILLYTYAITYIVLPLFLLVSIIYLCFVRNFDWKKWFVMSIPLGGLALPLILVQIVNIFELPEFRLGFLTITRMEIYRASELGKFNFCFFLKELASIFRYDDLPYNSIPNGYNLYRVTIALFLLGMISVFVKMLYSFFEKRLSVVVFIVFWFLVMLYYGSHLEVGVNRINGIYFVVMFVAVEAMWVLSRAKGLCAGTVLLIIAVLYAGGFLDFATYYYRGQYTADTYPLAYFDITVEEAVEFIDSNPELSQRKTYMAENAIYYAISALPSPYDFEWGSNMRNYGNYVFGGLGEIEEDANYIVHQVYGDYQDELRRLGFEEIRYANYSLFYMKNTL